MSGWRRLGWLCSGVLIGGACAAAAQPLMWRHRSDGMASYLPFYSADNHCRSYDAELEDAFRRKSIYARVFGRPPAPEAHAQSSLAVSMSHFTGGTRARFLRYATVDPESGEKVLTLGDFVACMLLLPPSRKSGAAKGSVSSDSGEAGDNLNWLAPQVQRRLAHFFRLVDMDTSNTVNYAEFVVLCTILSTRKRTLRLAFGMFDEDNNGRLSEVELTRVLNTLMVDPSVRMVNGPVTDTPAGKARDLTTRVPSDFFMRVMLGPLPVHESPPPGSSHLRSTRPSPYARSLMKLAAEDEAALGVSFDTFWYRMDFFRWELRAVEFGTFDPENSGTITLDDFRRILTGNLWQHRDDKRHRRRGDHSAVSASIMSSAESVPSAERAVTWQTYQKVFDIIRESDSVLPALQVSLQAEPPVAADVLLHGAVPDDYIPPAPTPSAKSDDGKRRSAKPEKLVRPTALTWKQFFHVLGCCDGVPSFTDSERHLLQQLLGSFSDSTTSVPSIAPAAFGQLCEFKKSFFVPYVPRFTEPKRNTVQQFFYCLQQLE